MPYKLIFCAVLLMSMSGCVVAPADGDRGDGRERVYERHDDRDVRRDDRRDERRDDRRDNDEHYGDPDRR